MPAPSRIVYPARPKPPRPFPRRTLLAIAGGLVLVAFAAGAIYLISRPALRIGRVEVRGAVRIPAGDVEGEVRRLASGKYGGLIPRDSILFLSAGAVRRGLRERFPQMVKVDVGRRFPQRLVISVTERTLWGVYCVRPQAGERQSCAYLDGTGTAYEALAGFEGWLLPVIYGPESALLGAAAVPAAALGFFKEARVKLGAIGADPLALTLSTSTPDDVRLTLAEGWQIWVTRSRPIGEWLGVLTTLLEQEIGERRSSLAYVDLRFGNKVFYRYR